jgi:hypothetical protein
MLLMFLTMLENICLTKMKLFSSRGINILVFASILWSVKTQRILFPDCPDLNAPSCSTQANVVNDASANPLRNPFTPGWAFQASPQVLLSLSLIL